MAYFVGCTADYTEPEVGKAVVDVLEALGIRVRLPDQRCCAIAQLASGRKGAFRKNAEFNLHALGAFKGDIVTACSSCAAALKHEYPRVLGIPEAETFGRRTYDILEYLVLLRERNELPPFRSVRLSLAYHAPCHLVALGGDRIEKRLELLRSIPELGATHIDRGCCGMGGTFGLKRRNYEISMAIGQALFAAIQELKPDMVISECPGCRSQIAHGTGLPAVHPIMIIRRALIHEGARSGAPTSKIKSGGVEGT